MTGLVEQSVDLATLGRGGVGRVVSGVSDRGPLRGGYPHRRGGKGRLTVLGNAGAVRLLICPVA